MGINPCPLSSLTTPDGGRQLGINPGSPDGGQQIGINSCPYTMEDNNWESTHVYQTHLLGVCSHKNGRQRMRQGLQNPLVLGSHDHNKQLVGSHPISTRLILPQQQTWCHQTANNKWALTHVC
jgi:hypothetical protein